MLTTEIQVFLPDRDRHIAHGRKTVCYALLKGIERFHRDRRAWEPARPDENLAKLLEAMEKQQAQLRESARSAADHFAVTLHQRLLQKDLTGTKQLTK
jgi:hypothetical protein